MFCVSCRKELIPGAEVCSNCGKVAPAREVPAQDMEASAEAPLFQVAAAPLPARKSARLLLFGLVGLLLGAAILFAAFFFTGLLSLDGKSDAARIEGPGYDTPEEAAKAYLEALKNQDIDAMVAAFAVESYAANYDLEEMYEFYGAYFPTIEMPFPGSNSYNNEMNVQSRKSFITSRIIWQYRTYNVASLEGFEGMTILPSNRPDLISDMEKDTEDYIFADLEITGTQKPENLMDLYFDDRVQDNISKSVKPYGADVDEVADVVIEFDADGDSWYFCPSIICYEGRWYIQSLNGTIASYLGFSSMLGGIIRESDL